MVSLELVLLAVAVLSLSGLPACLMSPKSQTGQRITTALVLAGSLLGLVGTGWALAEAGTPSMVWDWFLPWGQFAVALDPLSAFFLALVFLVPALGSVYGLEYWKQPQNPENGQRLGLFYGLLAGSMALVTVARDGVLFLIAWEVMALAAYFAATVEEDNIEVRRAGWVYLIATHVGTICLMAMFVLWRQATGSFALVPAATAVVPMASAIFVLAVVGFGFKAGLMPLHVWLPGAHANAPSHVSAVMSGVMLKMGIYGIVRMTGLLPAVENWWGATLLTVGAVTGLAGIAFAIGQHDLKRLLAYSSIENIGIIGLGLGLALLGRSLARWDWVLLGMGGALLHVWNHGLFKSLLFMNAGAIIHATHTREINRMGGLGKRMPRAMALFTLGAVAICGLPPLNGLASEWLLYAGLFRTLGLNGEIGFPVAAVAAVVLAMIGALAVACFVKLLSAVFLGEPRSSVGDHAHDPGARMLAPMAVSAAGCVAIGLFPLIAAAPLENAVRTWTRIPDAGMTLTSLAPMQWITIVGALLLALAGGLALAMRLLPRSQERASAGTWDCGYAQPTSRMQYTGSSFGQSLVQIFAFLLFPRERRPSMHTLFPKGASFKSVVLDVVLNRLVMPLFDWVRRQLPAFRFLQLGQTHFYVLYILVVVIFLLVWAIGV